MTTTMTAAIPARIRKHIQITDEHYSGERVIRECEEVRCVNPDHHHVGTQSEASSRTHTTNATRKGAAA